MLREAFGILALSEKDLDPRALEAVLTARLETAEFHDIPRLLEAYRTVNGLLETQMWYWNPETTSIHHQDGSTIELRGASANVGVMTAPPPPNAPRNLAQSDADDVELIIDAPASAAPAPRIVRSAMSDDAPLVVDDEAETHQTAPDPPKNPVSPIRAPEAFEESVQLLPSKPPAQPAPPQDRPASGPKNGSVITGNARARLPEPPPAAQPRRNRADAEDEIESAHSTMVVIPSRPKARAPWVVGVAAIGLAAGLWFLQSQIGRSPQRTAAVPTTVQSRAVTPPPTPTAPPAAKPAAQKPAQKPGTATARPPALTSSTKPRGATMPKPTAVVVPPKPSKPSSQPTVRPANPPGAVATVKPATPPPAPIRPQAVVRPQQTPSFISARPVPPAPRPISAPVRKPVATVAPRAPVRPTATPPTPAVRPAAKPAARPAVTPVPTRPATTTTITPRPKPVSVPAPVAVIEAPKSTGLPDNLTREEYGRRYFNQKIFEVWQRSGAQLRYGSWEAIPLEIQTLDSGRFRTAVYIAPPPEQQEPPK